MGLYFFSGKGGVGKTHLSTSFAFHRVGLRRRVLLIEFSQLAQYSGYFQLEVGFKPKELKKDLFLSTWTGIDCLKEYGVKVLKSQRALELFMKIPLMGKLINIAPGLKEISVLGKLTSDYRNINFTTGFDDIIFDAPASGHFVSLLQAPQGLQGIVGVGAIKKQSVDILNCLKKSKNVFIGLVGDGSKFSYKERLETKSKIKKILGDKKIVDLNNFSKEFPRIRTGDWIKSAKAISPYWQHFLWS